MIKYNLQLLLEDHSLEIPPALQRNADGSLRFPEVSINTLPKSDELPRCEWADYEDRAARGRRIDAIAAQSIRRDMEKTVQDRKRSESIEKREKNIKAKEQKAKIIQQHREEFAKTFKWGWE